MSVNNLNTARHKIVNQSENSYGRDNYYTDYSNKVKCLQKARQERKIQIDRRDHDSTLTLMPCEFRRNIQ